MIKKQFSKILIILLFSLVYYLTTFHFQRMVSWIKIDLLNHDLYYQDIDGEANIHKISIKSFSIIVPKSFGYVAPQFVSMEDTFMGYIANSETKIYFVIDDFELEDISIPLTEEESMQRYGRKDVYKSYQINQDMIFDDNILVKRRIAYSKTNPCNIWLSFSYPDKEHKFNNHIKMIAQNVSSKNKETVIKIFQSVRIKH